jgi:hypothetical protein
MDMNPAPEMARPQAASGPKRQAAPSAPNQPTPPPEPNPVAVAVALGIVSK